jgi:hypothetical protein
MMDSMIALQEWIMLNANYSATQNLNNHNKVTASTALLVMTLFIDCQLFPQTQKFPVN